MVARATPVFAPPPPPQPRTSVPTAWFRKQLDDSIKKLVRPSTALTRRKELTLLTSLPREVFEEFMQPLMPGDAEGLNRDLVTNQLIPTKVTAKLNHYKYSIKRGSVTDRLFSLQQLDPEPKASPRPAAERATIGEDGISCMLHSTSKL